MRLLFFVIVLFFMAFPLQATDTTLVLEKMPYEQLFETARQQGKSVMLYFHFDGCGACRKMEKTAFRSKEVIGFFKKNYLCFDINTRKGKGIAINEGYGVRMHPTFLFLDAEGKLQHKIVGVFSAEDFLQHARSALESEKTLVQYTRAYEQGRRDPDFLREYCYLLRDAYELDSTLIRTYLATQSREELRQEHNLRFIYEFALYLHQPVLTFDSPAFQLLVEERERFDTLFEPQQVTVRILMLLNRYVYGAIEDGDSLRFEQLLAAMRPYDLGERHFYKEMDGRPTGMIYSPSLTLHARMAWHDKAGNEKAYLAALEAYTEKLWDDPEALNSEAWAFYEQEDDPARLQQALRWARRSVELTPRYINTDTLAALLFKLGQYPEALEQAEKALALAKEEGEDASGTKELVGKIRENMGD